MKKIGKNSGIVTLIILTLFCVFSFSACTSLKEEEEIEKGEDYELNQDISEWMDEGHKNTTVESSCFVIKSKAKQGTFNFYIKDRDEHLVSVFSTAEEFTGTSFFLQAGKKIYRLSGGSGIISVTRETENGLQIAYVVPKVAEVLVDFKIVSSFDKKDGDMIKMTSVVKNLKSRKENFALKLVMDTSIGEKSRYHFYGSNNEPIENETLYTSSRDNKWFITGNEAASFQILLNGADISVPDFVSVANYETLNTLNWEPAVLSSRTFDTVSSYNNSACCVSWKKEFLEKDEKFSRIMYFAVAAYPESLTSDRFFENYKNPEKPKNQAEVIKADGESTFRSENTPGVKEYVSSDEKYSEDYSIYDILQDYEENSEETDGDQYSVDYIRRLLNRIAELETSGKELNQEELLLLNAEIDEILLHLRENK